MIEVHFRCGACGHPKSLSFEVMAERLNDIATRGDEGRVALICDACEADPETARAKLLNPEPGMPIGAMPFTVGELKFLRDVMGDIVANGGSEEREQAARILAVVNPALASVEAQAQTLGVQITDRINAMIEQEGIQLVPKP